MMIFLQNNYRLLYNVESENVTITALVSQEDLILMWAISLLGVRTSGHLAWMENKFCRNHQNSIF